MPPGRGRASASACSSAAGVSGRDDFVDRPERAGELLWHPTRQPRRDVRRAADARRRRDHRRRRRRRLAGLRQRAAARARRRCSSEPRWPAAITAETLEPWYRKTEEALRAASPRRRSPPLRKVQRVRGGGRARRPGRRAAADRRPLRRAARAPVQRRAAGGLPEPRALRHRLPGAREEHRRHHLRRARGDARRRGASRCTRSTRLEPPAATATAGASASGASTAVAPAPVEAPPVVLAAGTLGSPRLLLTNRRRLPGLSPALGTCFSGNGDALGVAFDARADGVREARNDFGPVMTSALDYTEDRRLILADGGLPPGFDGDPRRRARRQRHPRLAALAAAAAAAARPAGLDRPGAAPARGAPARSDRPQTPNRDALIFLMFGRDAADGRMRLTPLLRRFDIRWSKAGSAQLFADLERTANELARRRTRRRSTRSRAGRSSTFTTVHPLGGCPMADDPATQRRRRRRPRARLCRACYVLDGSIVPTALGVNPSKTIAALAERGVGRVLRRGAGLSPTWRNHARRPALPPARASCARVARGARRSWSAEAECEGTTRARGRRRPRVVRRRADRRLPRGDRPAERPLARRRTLRTPPARTRARARPRRHPHPRRSTRRSTPAGSRCATWAATTRRRSPASWRPRRTAPGSRFGPFPDSVRSLDLVVAGGERGARRARRWVTDPRVRGTHGRADARAGRRHVPRRRVRHRHAWA